LRTRHPRPAGSAPSRQATDGCRCPAWSSLTHARGASGTTGPGRPRSWCSDRCRRNAAERARCRRRRAAELEEAAAQLRRGELPWWFSGSEGQVRLGRCDPSTGKSLNALCAETGGPAKGGNPSQIRRLMLGQVVRKAYQRPVLQGVGAGAHELSPFPPESAPPQGGRSHLLGPLGIARWRPIAPAPMTAVSPPSVVVLGMRAPTYAHHKAVDMSPCRGATGRPRRYDGSEHFCAVSGNGGRP
jgi:hypothetical protein